MITDNVRFENLMVEAGTYALVASKQSNQNFEDILRRKLGELIVLDCANIITPYDSHLSKKIKTHFNLK